MNSRRKFLASSAAGFFGAAIVFLVGAESGHPALVDSL